MRTDIFYITPCSRRLRTFPEIQRYLQTRGITNLPLECFTFSRKLELGEVQDDQDEGGIKISRRGRKRTLPPATPTSGDETIAAMTTISGKASVQKCVLILLVKICTYMYHYTLYITAYGHSRGSHL